MKTNEGFIALFSVIIISFVLLILTVSLNFSSLVARFNIFNSEVKETSGETADACVEIARLAIATENYTVNEVTNVVVDLNSGNECKYKVLSSSSAEICSAVSKSYTFYEVEFDTSDDLLQIDSFAEVVPESADLSTNGTCQF